MARFQADAPSFANSDNHHPSRLALSGLIFLLGERDADFGNGARRGAGRILDQAALLIVDEHGFGLGIWRRGYRQAAVLRSTLSVVYGKFGLFPVQALAAQDKEGTNESETEQDENQQRNQKIDHGRRQAFVAVVTSDESSRKRVQHVGGRVHFYM